MQVMRNTEREEAWVGSTLTQQRNWASHRTTTFTKAELKPYHRSLLGAYVFAQLSLAIV